MIVGLLWAGGALFTGYELVRYVVAPDERRKPEPEPEPELEPEPERPATVRIPDAPTDGFEQIEASLSLSAGALALSVVGWAFPVARLLSLPPLLLGMVPVVRDAWQNLRETGRPDFAALITIGTFCELSLGYTGLAALNWLVYTGGLRLEAAGRREAETSLEHAFAQRLETAWIVEDGVEVEVPIAELDVDDRLIVQTGDTIPVDGRIVEGIIAVDQRALTGESKLIELGVGDEVLAATVVLGGTAQLVPIRTGAETVAARFEALLRETESYEQQLRSRAEAEADRSVRPTLVLMGFATVSAGLTGAISGYWANSADLAWFGSPYLAANAIRVAAQTDILIKDGRSLELLAEVDTIIFDKTGTLTLDTLALEAIHRFGSETEDEILALAAALERHQQHPIAEAIRAAADRARVTPPRAEQLELALGYGLRARIDGRRVLLGGARFMAAERVAEPPSFVARRTHAATLGHTLIHLAIDGECVAVLELAPQLRPEVPAVISRLRERGLALMLVSGDDEGPSAALAARLGLDRYHARALPEDKGAIIEALQAEGRTVCFIGDGVNDGLALRRAKVSISLTGATSLAIETAQILLQSGTLRELDALFELADEFARGQRTIVRSARYLTTVGGLGFLLLGFSLPSMIWLYAGGVALTTHAATRPSRLALRSTSPAKPLLAPSPAPAS